MPMARSFLRASVSSASHASTMTSLSSSAKVRVAKNSSCTSMPGSASCSRSSICLMSSLMSTVCSVPKARRISSSVPVGGTSGSGTVSSHCSARNSAVTGNLRVCPSLTLITPLAAVSISSQAPSLGMTLAEKRTRPAESMVSEK